MTSFAAANARHLPAWVWLLALGAVFPFVVSDQWAYPTGIQLLILVLVGLSLTVTVGWLRVITLFQPAAVAAGAAVTAGLVAGGRSFVLALIGATAAGAATGWAVLVPAQGDPRRWLPATSLVMTAAGALLVPRYVFRPFAPPELLGADLGQGRALYLVGLAVVTVAGFALARVRRTDIGRRLLVVGADPALAERSGDDLALGDRSGEVPAAVWTAGLVVSGALAGAAGCLTALLYQGLPNPLEFSPTAAVAYVAMPLVGGTWLIGGALAGAVVFLLAARLSLAIGLASVTLPALLVLAAAAVHRPGGIVGWVAQADGPFGRFGSR